MDYSWLDDQELYARTRSFEKPIVSLTLWRGIRYGFLIATPLWIGFMYWVTR